MSRKPFQMRMDADRLDRLARVAAKMQMSKTDIIEAALDVRLDLLEGYAALDTSPPKTAAAVKRQVAALQIKAGAPAEFVQPRTKHKPVGLTGAGRSIRGYDALTGEALYR